MVEREGGRNVSSRPRARAPSGSSSPLTDGFRSSIPGLFMGASRVLRSFSNKRKNSEKTLEVGRKKKKEGEVEGEGKDPEEKGNQTRAGGGRGSRFLPDFLRLLPSLSLSKPFVVISS